MPWQQTDQVNERLKFVAEHQRGRLSMTELCRKYGVSRKTGYKLLSRHAEDGHDGLTDRSRAPKTHPNQTSPSMEAEILRVRKAHPRWGSKKILAVLGREHAESDLPARSTVDAILKRAGLVQPRRCRKRQRSPAPPLVEATAPNSVWSIDYKGWFRVGDGTRCDPLTINDSFSRASLECHAMVAPKLPDVRRRLELTFHAFGLPQYILSDNGPPFASTGLARLSRLGVWLIRLGIEPIFIEPGHPEQNGRHERFHETLKAETAMPPRASIRAQQAAFLRFQQEYNEDRPHEALGMQVPAQVYECSPRTMPAVLPEIEYGPDLAVRRVRRDGSMKWANGYVYVGEAIAGELVGLKQVDDLTWHVNLGPRQLGVMHERSRTIVPVEPVREGVTHVPGQAQA